MIESATSVVASLCSTVATCRRNLAISACSRDGDRFASPGRLLSNKPASRWRRQSDINDEHRPAPRRYAASRPVSHAASYSDRYVNFCAGVNERRRARPSGSEGAPTAPSSIAGDAIEVIRLIETGNPQLAPQADSL